MNQTLHDGADSCDHALRIELNPSSASHWPLKRPALRGIELLSIRVTNALSALGATSTHLRVMMWSRLRCHFITTTELSKNTLPTRFSNWRNSESSSPSDVCQRLTRPTKGFFSEVFPAVAGCPALRCQPSNGLLKTCLHYIGRRPHDNPPQNRAILRRRHSP